MATVIRGLLVVVLGAATALLTSCNCDQSRCIPWAEIGSGYDVELLSLVRAGPDEEPYQAYAGDEHSCAGLGDLDLGSRLRFTARRTTDKNRECQDCQFVQARVEPTEQVEILEEDPGFVSDVPEPWFALRTRVAIQGNCMGEYSIGLMPVRSDFIEQRVEAVPSDHVLVREFRTITGGLCGSGIATCWDSWYVRITDMDGAQVSQEEL